MALEIEIGVEIKAAAPRVWAEISDIEHQVEWMEDAVAIRFTSPTTRGSGTTFDCDTHVLFFSLTDRMVVSQWHEGRSFTVDHQGAFAGRGTFSVTPLSATKSLFTWNEKLQFPWYFGSHIGELLAEPILTNLWTGDLQSLKVRCEAPEEMNPLAFFAELGQRVVTKRRGGRWIVDVGEYTKYAEAKTAYGARQAALHRWLEEYSGDGKDVEN